MTGAHHRDSLQQIELSEQTCLELIPLPVHDLTAVPSRTYAVDDYEI